MQCECNSSEQCVSHYCYCSVYNMLHLLLIERCIDGWDATLQAGRSGVRLPMGSLIFFFSVHLILPASLWLWGLLSLKQKWVPENLSWGKTRPASNADYLNAICEHCLGNVGSSISHNLTGLYGLLQGWLLFLFVLCSLCGCVFLCAVLNLSVVWYFVWYVYFCVVS
jgi:hypothetical protein